MSGADRPRRRRASSVGRCFVTRLLCEQGGASEKRWVGMGHDKCRYCREIDVKAALRLEALAKRRFDESLTEFRNDAAANVDATAGTEGQRQITGHRTEHGAEHGRGFDAEWVLCADC